MGLIHLRVHPNALRYPHLHALSPIPIPPSPSASSPYSLLLHFGTAFVIKMRTHVPCILSVVSHVVLSDPFFLRIDPRN